MFTFDFSQDYFLENEQVMLRPLMIQDVQNLQEFALYEPDIWKYSLVPINDVSDLKGYIEMALAAKQSEKEYPFIVFDKKQQKYAGSTRFYDIQLQNQSLQLGYTWYGKAFQGHRFE